MQEEVENRTVNLAVSTSKLTARYVTDACMKYLRHRRRVKDRKAAEKAEENIPHGKQTVKDLIGQNQGVSNMDIAKTDLRGFEKVARKYGVDYAIRKDISAQPPRYLVFFKARDADALTAAFREYSASVMKKKDRQSVLAALQKMKELTASLPAKIRHKEKEHSL